MSNNTAFHFLTDETGQEILGAINDLVAAHGGSVTNESSAIEYGVRWVTDASSPTLERVIRKDGVISTWDISFTRNIGSDITENPFDYIGHSHTSLPSFVSSTIWISPLKSHTWQ